MTARAGHGPIELSIVLPAYNEQANIERAIATAGTVADRLTDRHEIVVVDDGSSDATAALVRSMAERDPRIRLITHPRNLGYGEALRTGVQAAELNLLLFTDADNQFDLDELEVFLPWIEHVDVVAGYRMSRQDSIVRRLNARAWNYLVRVLFYVPVRDIDCAFKLFRRDVFKRVDLEAVGAMVNTELMVKLGRAGVGVVEIGVTHRPRTAGKARGASPKVIAVAFTELFRMYWRLKSAGPHPDATRPQPPT